MRIACLGVWLFTIHKQNGCAMTMGSKSRPLYDLPVPPLYLGTNNNTFDSAEIITKKHNILTEDTLTLSTPNPPTRNNQRLTARGIN